MTVARDDWGTLLEKDEQIHGQGCPAARPRLKISDALIIVGAIAVFLVFFTPFGNAPSHSSGFSSFLSWLIMGTVLLALSRPLVAWFLHAHSEYSHANHRAFTGRDATTVYAKMTQLRKDAA